MDKKCWLSTRVLKPFTGNELCNYLIETESRIIVVSGPSNSGKTSIINKLKSKKTVNSVPYTFVTEYICRGIFEKPISREEFEAKTSGDFFCVEDVDFLLGKSVTQEVMGEMMREISKGCKVIITGIELRKKVPELLGNLGDFEEILYFE